MTLHQFELLNFSETFSTTMLKSKQFDHHERTSGNDSTL